MPSQHRPRALAALIAGAVLLVLLAVLTILVRSGPIQDDLAERSGRALQEAGIAARVDFEGRDATVVADVEPGAVGAVEEIVGSLWGVRAVEVRTSGTPPATATTAPPPATSTTSSTTTTTAATTTSSSTTTSATAATTTTTEPLTPVAVEITGTEAGYTVDGRVRDEAQRESLATAFEAAFATAAVDITVSVEPEASGGDWLPALAEAVGSLRGVDALRLSAAGSAVTVAGEVASEAAAAAVVAALERTGLTVDADLETAPPLDPAEAIALTGQLNQTDVRPDVLFASGSAELTAGATVYLDEIAQLLIATPGARVEVGGHTDSSGDAAANLALSQSRADAVVAYLVEAGVDPVQLTAVGYGATRPIAGNDTFEGQAQNRRIEFTVEGSS